ncbi:hypothetical protein ACFSJU_17255 [Paradesertivirga mongoliensis]|uniref:DUF4476 domain-containing protein n=1 Tax=Paradesertivirga mongoliensis TaxID=2100740 RepID=A0ABW4ZPX7_9SPHI|nr:hypothetical protein [Pedobacter mongoliensis]
MKKGLVCLSFFVLIGIETISAQSTFIKLNSINDADSIASIQYNYPHFRDGRVFFINNSNTPAKLNYSRVNGEILFKDKNNVLALNKLETVEMVTIAKDTFFVSPAGGFVKQIVAYPAVALVKTSRLKLLDRETKGAFGSYSKASGAKAITTLPGIDQTGSRVAVDENLSFTLTDTYYLLTSSKKLIEASEKAFLLAYPGSKKELKAYISSTNVNFNKENDLTRLLLFVQSLN